MRTWCGTPPTIRSPAPGIVGLQAVRDRPAGVRLETDARVVRRADAPDGGDSVRSSGELARAPTRTAAVVQPARRRRRARRRSSPSSASSPSFGQDIRDDAGCDPRRLPGARARWLVVTVLVTCAPIADPAPRAAAGAGDLGARDPRPHPRRLARGIAPARRAVPHLHGRRVVPAAQGGRRAGGRVRHDRRARARAMPPGSTPSACSASSPSSPPCGRSASRCATGGRRPTPGCARPTSEPRPSARAPPGCWPRSGCASPRSCTTSSPTRCRSSPCRPASAPTCSTTGRSRRAPRSRRSRPRRGARSPRCAACSACCATATAPDRHAPAPGLVDLPRLVDDVRAAGVPVTLHVEGDGRPRPRRRRAVRLPGRAGGADQRDQARRHADPCRRDGPLPARVAGRRGRRRRARPGGAAGNGADAPADGSGHGLVGMRERVEVWGGELSVGPAPGGGYRVRARLPYGDAE